MYGVALIAFDCQDRRILSTFVHGRRSRGGASGWRMRWPLKVAIGRLIFLEVPLRDFPALGMIDRVDTQKRRLVRRQA